jgi:uncharacterized protein YjbK
MSQEIEIEFKNLLTVQEFQKLIYYFQVAPSDFKTQTNHYFDTPSFQLKEMSSALRIREINEVYTLTLKQPHGEDLLETHQVISLEDKKRFMEHGHLPNGEIMDRLFVDTIVSSLTYFGSLKTTRAEIQYKDGKLVFDHSHYLNVEDYELEYEVTNRQIGHEIFTDLLKKMNIPVRVTDNKIKRFYEEKRKMAE